MDIALEKIDAARHRLQQRQPQKAAKLLRSVLQENPDNIEALKLLASIKLSEKKYLAAQELLEHAIELQPRSARLHMQLGITFLALGKTREAHDEQLCALGLNSGDGLVHFHLGNVQLALGMLNDAGHSFQRAVKLLPNLVAAQYRLGIVLSQAGANNAAVIAFKKVVELDPKSDSAYVDLGNALRRCGNDEQAAACYNEALRLNERSIGALNNLGILLRNRGNFAASAQLLRRAVEVQPFQPVLHNNLAKTLEEAGAIDEAKSRYQKAVDLNPNYARAHCNLARLERQLGDFVAAEQSYNRAMDADSNMIAAHYEVACLWLLRGEFERAWPKYRMRWNGQQTQSETEKTRAPAWDGNPLPGKTLLLHAGRSYSKALLFVRYAHRLKGLCGTLVLRCAPALASLLSRCDGIDGVVVADDSADSHADAHVDLELVPAMLNTRLTTIPKEVPYLFADENRVDEWRNRLDGLNGVRIGLAWPNAKSNGSDVCSRFDKLVARLAATPGVQLINLQRTAPRNELAEHFSTGAILDVSEEIDKEPDAFEKLAAVLKNINLVVSTDSCIAHLAGGLGVPTWLLLGSTPAWYWLLDRDDSPWYPTMKLFRESALDDCPLVFDAAAQQPN
jgi:tetratricopeptide (TPR) repeat protein